MVNKFLNPSSLGFILRFTFILLASFGVIATVDYYHSKDSTLPAAAGEEGAGNNR